MRPHRGDPEPTPSADQRALTLDPGEHRDWSTRHQHEVAAAEAWLAEVLGETSPQPDDVEERPSDGWSVEPRPGGLVVATHAPSGAVLTASLDLRAGARGARFRVARYALELPEDDATDIPTPPIDHIEQMVNSPASMQMLIDGLDESPQTSLTPMRLPAAMVSGHRRSDAFYARVAALVHACREQGISYGPRLARDNGVSEGTVRSWAHEARRRGLLAPTGSKPRRTPTSEAGDRLRRS
jgi:hypothetical protein